MKVDNIYFFCMIARKCVPLRSLCSKLLRAQLGTTTGSQIGLLGFQELKSKCDFTHFVGKSIKHCDELRKILHEVPNISQKSPQDTLLIIDAISNELCRVLDCMEFLRNAHESEEYQRQADTSFEKMSIYMQTLNSDTIIYERLEEIVSLLDELGLSPEESKFAMDMHDEFITEGIQFHHVNNKLYDPNIIKEIRRLKTVIVQLESQYMQNTTNFDLNIAPGRFLLGPFENEDSRDYSLIHGYLLSIGVEQTFDGNDAPHGYVVCPSGSQGGNCRQLLISLVFTLSSQKLRKIVWYELVQCPSANKTVFVELIAARYNLAKLLGYDSHTNRFQHTKLLKSSDEVYTFLQDFSNIIRKDAASELDTLKNLNNNISDIGPWDIDKLIHHSRKAVHVSGTGQSALERISKYFPLGKCISSLKMLCSELFDINMVQLPMSTNEKWASNEKLYKYKLIHNASNESLGYIYFDLFQRTNKFNNNAHFTIQCGCTNNSSERLINKYPLPKKTKLANWFGGVSDFTTQSVHDAPVSKIDANQLPVVVLTSNISGDNAAKLTYDQLENLYHEFGHALHSLLSRTTFQHLSGTRGSVDFIEIPSHLFEYFSGSKEVLVEWSACGSERIPLDLIDEAQAERSLFKNLELQSQILYSVSDQYLHGSSIGDVLSKESTMGTNELYHDMLANICELQAKYTVLPLARGDGETFAHPSMYPLAHSHYINYAGGYYTYLYAKLWSAQIWSNLFQDTPLSRSSGMYLWNNLLKYGAAKDPLTMLEALGKGDGKPIPLDFKYYIRNHIR